MHRCGLSPQIIGVCQWNFKVHRKWRLLCAAKLLRTQGLHFTTRVLAAAAFPALVFCLSLLFLETASLVTQGSFVFAAVAQLCAACHGFCKRFSHHLRAAFTAPTELIEDCY
jgi:hypothetical protein